MWMVKEILRCWIRSLGLEYGRGDRFSGKRVSEDWRESNLWYLPWYGACGTKLQLLSLFPSLPSVSLFECRCINFFSHLLAELVLSIAMRAWPRLGNDLHEWLPLDIVRCSSAVSTSVVMAGRAPLLPSETQSTDGSAILVATWGGDGTPLQSISDQYPGTSPAILFACDSGCLPEGRPCPALRGLLERVRPLSVCGSVTEIGEKAFYRCKISALTFGGSSLRRIGPGAFCECLHLSRMHIPDTVEEIGQSCFSHCSHLQTIMFGESSSLKSMPSWGFSTCGLVEIHVPETVEVIGAWCFSWCVKLTSVKFGQRSSLKRIEEGAFAQCALTKVKIPDSVEELGDMCFYRCNKLTRVAISPLSSLRIIGVQCFYGCASLLYFSIPSSLQSMGGSAFSDCRKLRAFLECDGGCGFSVVRSLVLSSDMRVCYGPFGSVSDVVIPNTVEVLCDQCFYECPNLRSVTLEEETSLKRIGERAFQGSGLHSIKGPESAQDVVLRDAPSCRYEVIEKEE